MADRVPGNVLALTHAVLANLLGVQRPTLSNAAGALEARGLIRSHRGSIALLNRLGLEKAACPCYAVSKAQNPASC